MLSERQLLNRLRLWLTGVYIAAALSFIVILAGLSVALLRFYFQSSIDSSLRNRMALEYAMLGVPIPAELERSYLEWMRLRAPVFAPPVKGEHDREPGEAQDEEHDDEEALHSYAPGNSNNPLAAQGNMPVEDLVSVFVIRLDPTGRVLVPSAVAPAGFSPNLDAIATARRYGVDWRTVWTVTGEPVRLLTYAVQQPHVTLYLQAGRSLLEQDAIARQFVIGLLLGGGMLVLVAAWVSWSIAGRAIRPVRETWARQREFIANASHELRAPLSLIQLSAELATRPDTPPDERRELAGDVLRETRHMIRLVNDLLLLSRADAGRLPLRIEGFPLQHVLDDLARIWGRACAEHALTLEVEPTAASVRADADYVRHVLMSVLDNALRYTPPGGSHSPASCAAWSLGGHHC
ncbi:MAG: histidine kinase [Candidatus Roseilinea sp.]|nr:MAG: histidine kinase [Candidatus Roseilinea sp.]